MKKRTKQNILSFILTSSTLLTMSSIPAWAEPEQALSDGSLANPVHHCTKKDDGTDDTDWSYIYFGSYPQTEVTGSELTSAITGADYDGNGDAWVDGTKYRRISKNDTNDDSYFGDNDYRYFKWERIKWRVLENDGATLFIAADKGLDCKTYNEEDTSVIWEDCTLRKWLGDTFYHSAFSDSEQDAIVEQSVINEDHPFYDKMPSNNTQDNIYLLSIGEVTDPSYGFCEEGATGSVSRQIEASDYSHVMGASINVDDTCQGSCCWWLRSMNSIADCAAGVLTGGFVYRIGVSVDSHDAAIVPALHITAAAAEPIKEETSEIVREVISGKWGNMPERKQRLEAAGYNYAKVQAEVNALIKESESMQGKY